MAVVGLKKPGQTSKQVKDLSQTYRAKIKAAAQDFVVLWFNPLSPDATSSHAATFLRGATGPAPRWAGQLILTQAGGKKF